MAQVTVWNKIDAVALPETVRAVAAARERDGTVCISAASGEGIEGMLALLDRYIAALLLPVRCMLPFSQVRVLASVPTTYLMRLQNEVRVTIEEQVAL